MVSIPHIPAAHLGDLQVGALRGRKVELPDLHGTHKPILLIYGHHSSLERMYSTAQALNAFGPVTMPDLPGFGGMMSLSGVGKRPTLDNLADYLAQFIRQRYARGQKFTAVGVSLGFVIITRMLQRHPELCSQINHLVSSVGFAHWQDFGYTPGRMRLYRHVAKTMARRPTAAFFHHVLLRHPVIGSIYHLRARNHPKMKGFTWQERQRLIEFEVQLWRTNEVRTYFSLGYEMLTLDLTGTPLPLAVEHVAVDSDQYFNNQRIAGHLGQIFTEVRMHGVHGPSHAPTVIEGIEAASQFLPPSLREVLRK